MKSIESSGKTVDEAIFKGLDQMSLSIDEVDIEILEEGGRRLFGIGSKQSVVRLTERAKESVEQALEQARQQQEAEQKQRQERRERSTDRYERGADRPPRQSGGQRDRRQDGNRERGDRHDRNRGAERDRQGGRERRPEPVPTAFEGQPAELGQEGEFLKGVLERMGVECEIKCLANDEAKYFEISGNGMGVLIGRRGETLNALQYLCSLIANKGDGEYFRVIVDTENYRGRREVALVKLAENKANMVKRSGRSVRLEPMNPYDRRVLHATLQNNPHVKTHSEGDEPNRRVVITKK